MAKAFTDYHNKKAFFDRLLTIYGRKPVLEALRDNNLNIYKVHLARSNKSGGIIDDIISLAEQRQIDIQWHGRSELARISRNSKQDQGVAADIDIDQHQSLELFLQNQNLKSKSLQSSTVDRSVQNNKTSGRVQRLLALCNIHNPQNLGMIIRSACAGGIDGIVIPEKGCAPLSPLVIKASAGTLFKAPIIKCEKLTSALDELKNCGVSICTLSSHATDSLFDHKPQGPVVYVLGNESEGISNEIFSLADKKLKIPMSNEVESLNVAVTAALIAFSNILHLSI